MMKKMIFSLLAVMLTMTVHAQLRSLTDIEQAALQEEAEILVNRFQNNCQLIAADGAYHEKIARGGAIDVAMKDFVEYPDPKDGPNIEITSLDGNTTSRKLVKTYLRRLAKLRKDLYKTISITWHQLGFVGEFKADPNRPGWYVGEVSVVQKFSAVTREMIRVEDEVVRTAKVYATQEEYRKGNIRKNRWRIYLGDIAARTIQ